MSTEPTPSLIPPTSSLSDAPPTSPMQPAGVGETVKDGSVQPNGSVPTPSYSAQTESIIKRINETAANAAATGTPGLEAAKEQIMRDMATSDTFPAPVIPPGGATPARDGRGGKLGGHSSNPISGRGENGAVKTETIDAKSTAIVRGRGRGGRPRGRGRGRGSGRGGKRKREDRSDNDDSDDSEVYTPLVTTTKSGRSVQKPVSFVPPPLSPTTTPNKRKRTYRRNPESAVCKVCLRGTSPASNMIVFCDGCNVPYHRMCHHPPIDQAVVDEVDKEWYCKQCENQRLVPVAEREVADFVSAPGASVEQRQRYFASLPPGVLVTLLTQATTLQPSLPVFAPGFQARQGPNSSTITHTAPATIPAKSNGHNHRRSPIPPISSVSTTPAPLTSKPSAKPMTATDDEEYGPEEHPAHYPRPGQGLMRTLPPEQEDLQWLVEDEDRFGVFSHVYQADERPADGTKAKGDVGRGSAGGDG